MERIFGSVSSKARSQTLRRLLFCCDRVSWPNEGSPSFDDIGSDKLHTHTHITRNELLQVGVEGLAFVFAVELVRGLV